MANGQRRSFTPPFEADAVKLCQPGDQRIRQVAKTLDLTKTALRDRMKLAEREIAPSAGVVAERGTRLGKVGPTDPGQW
jgi:transposase-like protein